MRKTEALKFIKRIIEMGKEKGQSTKTIKTNIETYIDILVSDNTIDAETEKTLRNVVKNIKGIVSGKSSVDQVVKKEKVLLEKAAAKQRQKKIDTTKVIVATLSEGACGGGTRRC